LSREALKFLQISDLHLGAGLAGGRLKLPYDKIQIRAREMREVVKTAIELARNEAVEAMLIPGDLWEQDGVSLEDINYILDYFERAQIPILIAPGNHDYYYPSSHYNDNLIASTCRRRWPSNVHIFRDYEFDHIMLPELPEVVFSGFAYRSASEVHIRLLESRVETPDAALHICLLHGSRDNNLPNGKMRTLPFSDADLLNQPFDWTALGHYHRHSIIQDDQGRIRAAYTGAASAFSLNETEAGGALLGVVRPGGVKPDELKLIQLDARRIHHLSMDITGCAHTQAVEERIEAGLRAGNVGKDDIALVELTGAYPPGSRIFLSEDFIRSACWFLRVETERVLPEWSLEGLSEVNPRTTEGLFIARIKQMMEDADRRGDTIERQRLQHAMQYGLNALHSRPINVR